MAPGKQTLDANFYEVIVSDDGEDYPAGDFCKAQYPWVRYTNGPRKGPAANRNNGARLAVGDWLVFTDDDCLPDAGWLQAYDKAIVNNPESIALEGKTIALGIQKRFDETAPLNEKGGNFWSCNIAINHLVFTVESGFDIGFPYAIMEDTDLYERLKLRSTVPFIPTALIMHPWRSINCEGLSKKLLASHYYFLQKRGVKFSLVFRLQRVKLAGIRMIENSIKLIRFQFAGYRYWLELFKFYLCMILLTKSKAA